MKLLEDLEGITEQITDDAMRHNLHYSRSEFIRTVYDEDVDDNEWTDISKSKKKPKKNIKKNIKKTTKKTKKTDKEDKEEEIDEDEAKNTIIITLKDYISEDNVTPILLFAKKGKQHSILLIKEILAFGVEKEKNIEKLSLLLLDLAKGKIIENDVIIAGIKLFFTFYQDLSVDVPKIPDYASQLLTRTIVEKYIDINWFTIENIKECKVEEKAAKNFLTELNDKVAFTS